MYENMAVISIFALLYSVVVGRVERTALSGPLVFVGFGLLASPQVLDWLHLDIAHADLRIVADLTLALVLFNDAAAADLRVLRRTLELPQRMLLLGLPMTILAGVIVGLLTFDDLGIFQLALLATMLAATDAALGKAVITNPKVPQSLREGLNIESGLNDGICVPILYVFIAICLDLPSADETGRLVFELLLREIGIGLIVGLGVAIAGSLLLGRAARNGWLTNIWLQIPAPAMAVGAFSLAQTLDGSGYIAAFTGGLLFGSRARRHTRDLIQPSEGLAELLAMITWIIFGAVIVGDALGAMTWPIFIYALLSLTLVRMMPIYVALSGSGAPPAHRLFLGWFGPRGLASIVFAIIVIGDKVPHAETLSLVVVCTVLLSVVMHGISATPLANWLARRDQRSRDLP